MGKNSVQKSQAQDQRKQQTKEQEQKSSGLLKRFASRWNLFFGKLRGLSSEIFSSDDEGVDELFRSKETPKGPKLATTVQFTPDEKKFLKQYSNHKDLNAMSDHVNNNKTTAAPSETEITGLLSDVLEYKSSGASAEKKQPGGETINSIPFDKLDVCTLRKEYDQLLKNEKWFFIGNGRKASLDASQSYFNIGEVLWQIRRNKWLDRSNSPESKTKERNQQNSLQHLPKESYGKIYNNFVSKNKPLKDGKRINLDDMIAIINEGWIADDTYKQAS